MTNNIVLNCSDVGIYLNQATNSKIFHNTLANVNGLDVRFSFSTATIGNNVVASQIRNRDGGTHIAGVNLTSTSLDLVFANASIGDLHLLSGTSIVGLGQPSSVTQVARDFCGFERDAGPDLGAIEYHSDNPCPKLLYDFISALP